MVSHQQHFDDDDLSVIKGTGLLGKPFFGINRLYRLYEAVSI